MITCAKIHKVVAVLTGGAQEVKKGFCVLPPDHEGNCLVVHPDTGELLEIEHLED